MYIYIYTSFFLMAVGQSHLDISGPKQRVGVHSNNGGCWRHLHIALNHIGWRNATYLAKMEWTPGFSRSLGWFGYWNQGIWISTLGIAALTKPKKHQSVVWFSFCLPFKYDCSTFAGKGPPQINDDKSVAACGCHFFRSGFKIWHDLTIWLPGDHRCCISFFFCIFLLHPRVINQRWKIHHFFDDPQAASHVFDYFSVADLERFHWTQSCST